MTYEEMMAAINAISNKDLGEASEQRGKIELERIRKEYKLGREDIENRFRIASMESGDRRARIEFEREAMREELALAREEMERIGIPTLELEREIAATNREIALGELAYKNATLEEEKRQFNEEMGFDREKFAEDTRRFGLEYALAEAEASGYLNGAPTLERERFLGDQAERDRRFQFDVSQFGAQLSATPDTYWQAQRFQANDLPRLLGQQVASTPMYGGPTPQISTLGARLGAAMPGATVGAQPWAATTTGSVPGVAQGGPVNAPGTDPTGGGMPGPDERAKQLAAIARAAPPSPYDGLSEQDAAALRLIETVYKKGGQGVNGADYERLRASGRLGYLQSAGKLLGYDPKEFEAQNLAYRAVQGSGAAA